MVAATDEIVDALRGSGFMFFTFTGADAMCAGAAAVLDVLEREHLVERSAAMGDVLADRLDDALGGHPAVVDIRGRGMFRGIELRAERRCPRRRPSSPSAWPATCGSTRPAPASPR